MKKLIALMVLLSSLCLVSNAAEANEHAWVLTLGGNGSSATTGDSQSAFGAEVSFGRTGRVLLPLEIGVRQSLSYSSVDDGAVVGGTKVYADATLLKLWKLDLFAGGNVGAFYGNTPLTWVASPEAGLRFWLRDDVGVVGRVEYPFSLNDQRALDKLQYSVLLQVKF